MFSGRAAFGPTRHLHTRYDLASVQCAVGCQYLKVVAASSPIHCHIGTVPCTSAPAMSRASSSCFALKQIGQT